MIEMNCPNINCPRCGRIMEEREFYSREIFPWVKDDSGPKLLFNICMCGYQIQIGRIDPVEFEEWAVEK